MKTLLCSLFVPSVFSRGDDSLSSCDFLKIHDHWPVYKDKTDDHWYVDNPHIPVVLGYNMIPLVPKDGSGSGKIFSGDLEFLRDDYASIDVQLNTVEKEATVSRDKVFLMVTIPTEFVLRMDDLELDIHSLILIEGFSGTVKSAIFQLRHGDTMNFWKDNRIMWSVVCKGNQLTMRKASKPKKSFLKRILGLLART